MNKRGQAGLPMNTLIVAIIAIIVLLLIVTFFTGGLGTIGEKIRDIFGKGTAGYDLNIARNFCTDYCNSAKRLVKEGGVADTDAQKNSAYCHEKFDIKQGPGVLQDRNCKQVGVTCSGVQDQCEGEGWS